MRPCHQPWTILSKNCFLGSSPSLSSLHDCFWVSGSIALPVTVTGAPSLAFVTITAPTTGVRAKAPHHLRLEPTTVSAQTPDLCLRFFKCPLIVLSINSYFVHTKYSLLSNNPECSALASVFTSISWTIRQSSNSVIFEPS